MREQMIDFLKENPNSNKAAIIAGTGIKGLPLFNLLKRLVNEGEIVSAGDDNNATYAINENNTEEQGAEVQTGETENETTTETVVDAGQKDITTPQPTEAKPTRTVTTRDNSKYKFNGQDGLGKGPLVRAVIAKYVEDNPTVTYKQLKEVFPDTLMKRFGVFAGEEEAKKLSGNKPRYFMKPEQMITIKGQKEPIAICNQWTATLLEPFLKIVKELGYKIK